MFLFHLYIPQLNCVAFEQVTVSWNKYLDFLRHDNGNLSAFWMSYVDILGAILVGLLRASREGNWHLHLSAISKIIPWLMTELSMQDTCLHTLQKCTALKINTQRYTTYFVTVNFQYKWRIKIHLDEFQSIKRLK